MELEASAAIAPGIEVARRPDSRVDRTQRRHGKERSGRDGDGEKESAHDAIMHRKRNRLNDGQGR
jgi:hypothetical protein